MNFTLAFIDQSEELVLLEDLVKNIYDEHKNSSKIYITAILTCDTDDYNNVETVFNLVPGLRYNKLIEDDDTASLMISDIQNLDIRDFMIFKDFEDLKNFKCENLNDMEYLTLHHYINFRIENSQIHIKNKVINQNDNKIIEQKSFVISFYCNYHLVSIMKIIKAYADFYNFNEYKTEILTKIKYLISNDDDSNGFSKKIRCRKEDADEVVRYLSMSIKVSEV